MGLDSFVAGLFDAVGGQVGSKLVDVGTPACPLELLSDVTSEALLGEAAELPCPTTVGDRSWRACETRQTSSQHSPTATKSVASAATAGSSQTPRGCPMVCTP